MEGFNYYLIPVGLLKRSGEICQICSFAFSWSSPSGPNVITIAHIGAHVILHVQMILPCRLEIHFWGWVKKHSQSLQSFSQSDVTLRLRITCQSLSYRVYRQTIWFSEARFDFKAKGRAHVHIADPQNHITSWPDWKLLEEVC